MSKITVDLFNDLSDEFGKYICESKEDIENMSSVGFSCNINPIKCENVEKEYNKYLYEFKKYIHKLIKCGNINKIYHIWSLELARLSPTVRFSFICYCNEIKSSAIHVYKEGETPDFYNIGAISGTLPSNDKIYTEAVSAHSKVSKVSELKGIVIDEFSYITAFQSGALWVKHEVDILQ